MPHIEGDLPMTGTPTDLLAALTDALAEADTTGDLDYEDLAAVAVAALDAHVWLVPKVVHDENLSVTPYLSRSGEWIRRDAGDSGPDHTRVFAAQLLAAADECERREQMKVAS
jgi:hypothetical protein